MEASFDLEDRQLFERGVQLLYEFGSSSKILGPNFGVAIAVLIHRGLGGVRGHSAPPELIFRPDSGDPIRTGELQKDVCDATFEKDAAYLPSDHEGPVYKPFSPHFKPGYPDANNWRNSLDLQVGLGCNAPYTADFLRSPEYLAERRVDCTYRDSASGQCSSPAGPPGRPPTCFNTNKRGAPPKPNETALDRPKLLSRGTQPRRGFWYVEPTADVLAGLLADPDMQVPLYPWITAMYGGSAYFKQWGTEISRSRFEADLQLDSARFLTLFDPDPGSQWNAPLLSGVGTIVGGDPADAGGEEPLGAGNREPLKIGQPLSTPVPYQSRDIGFLISRADSNPDPAKRARLLERARRGHQRALEELASAVARRGDFVLTEQLDGYDLLAIHGDTGHLFEVKTWSPGNLAGQIRRGWAQLREYRYRNRRRLPNDVRLYLVLDRPPPKGLWIWSFLVGDCDVIPAWMEEGEIKTLPELVDLLP